MRQSARQTAAWRTLIGAAIAMLAVSCSAGAGDGPTAPAVPLRATSAVALRLSGFPQDDVVLAGTSSRLVVQPVDDRGADVLGASAHWTSSNPAVLEVAADGTFTAASSGVVTVSATIGGLTASASLSVHDKIMVPDAGREPAQISVLGGAVVLSVPAAASVGVSQLDVGVALAPVPTPALVASPAYEFGPSGLQLDKPITVTMSYGAAGSSAPPGSLVLGYLNQGSWVPVPGSTQDPVTRTVSAPLMRLSTYAVVMDPVASVSVTPATATISEGQTLPLFAAASDAGGNPVTGRTIIWATSDPTVATVSATGLMSGVGGGGPVTMTATCEGKSATLTVMVVGAETPVATLSVSPAAARLAVGTTTQLAATARDAGGATLLGRPVSWSTSDPMLATVDATGLVKAIAPGGPVTITATTQGKTATAAVTVIADTTVGSAPP
jgi:uncharacterized protein YjdB